MYAESVAATVIGVTTLSMLRRFEDKDDRTRRRLTLTLTQSALPTQALVAKLADLDLLPTVEGWNLESAASLRQLTLAVRLPRGDGEARLVAALESEAGITRMQLDVRAQVPNATQAHFMEAALAARTNCPIARLLHTNISMSAILDL